MPWLFNDTTGISNRVVGGGVKQENALAEPARRATENKAGFPLRSWRAWREIFFNALRRAQARS
jgi:hypothetical protein